MDVKMLLDALTADALTELESHYVEAFITAVVTDLRSSRYDEDREWAAGVEEFLIDQWGPIEGL